MENQEALSGDALAPRPDDLPAAFGEEITAAGDEPAADGTRERARLDLALTTARRNAAPDAPLSPRRSLPGLRKELFPAATWRRELEALHQTERDRAARKLAAEEARMAVSLAELRAEEILREARAEARRLVNTASAVARARQEQAERLAEAKVASAEAQAAATLAEASQRSEAKPADHGVDMQALYGKLLRMQSALRDAEARLDAFATSTRAEIAARGGVVDLEALAADEELEGAYGPPTPRVRPKSRFAVPGLTPERIEALRDEFLAEPS